MDPLNKKNKSKVEAERSALQDAVLQCHQWGPPAPWGPTTDASVSPRFPERSVKEIARIYERIGEYGLQCDGCELVMGKHEHIIVRMRSEDRVDVWCLSCALKAMEPNFKGYMSTKK